MKIGVPKEIKNNESRVGLTPAGVFELIKNNHDVFVQSGCGEGSGFSNEDYVESWCYNSKQYRGRLCNGRHDCESQRAHRI